MADAGNLMPTFIGSQNYRKFQYLSSTAWAHDDVQLWSQRKIVQLFNRYAISIITSNNLNM